MLTHKIVTKIADVSHDWEELIKESETATIFQTRSYLKAWSDTFCPNEKEHFLIEVYQGEKLLAVAPFRKEGNKLTFLGTDRLESGDLVTDFGDLIIKKGEEKPVWEHLLDKLPQEGISQLELDYLRESSASLKVLKTKNFFLEPMLDNNLPDVAPSMNLPDSWEEHLTSLDRKARHELRRKMRRIGERNVRYDFTQNPKEGLVEFFRLHKASTEEKDDFMTPLMEKFFTNIVNNLGNLIQIATMKVDEINVSATIAFFWTQRSSEASRGTEYWLYNSGFDRTYTDLSVGLLLKAQTVKWAIENGFKKYNFLRGNERYKYELGAKDEGLYKVEINF